MRFVDLCAGIGGFNKALSELGHRCVAASEIDPELRALYSENFAGKCDNILGDIRKRSVKSHIPEHDILCAGFPCQPFSKSGDQRGFEDKTRGTLYHEIYEVLKKRRPKYVILENVGNFAKHDAGKTWQVVKGSLERLGYAVEGTEHICDGGHGLISPHHLGYPHHRERFFAVATQGELPREPFPPRRPDADTSVADISQDSSELSKSEVQETRLSDQQKRCIEQWDEFLSFIPKEVEFPSCPIWADEAEASYPFEGTSPSELATRELRLHVGAGNGEELAREELLARLPNYASRNGGGFPKWKKKYIRRNREWFDEVREYIPERWFDTLESLPESQRKFEWNCRGERRALSNCVLQFRPSGLRAKRYSSIPSMVSMTVSQIPILGPQRRYITRTEGLRLQGFRDDHKLPSSRSSAFAALGNAVHVGVVKEIAERLTAPREAVESTEPIAHRKECR